MNQRNLSGDQEIIPIYGLTFHKRTKLLQVTIRYPLTSYNGKPHPRCFLVSFSWIIVPIVFFFLFWKKKGLTMKSATQCGHGQPTTNIHVYIKLVLAIQPPILCFLVFFFFFSFPFFHLEKGLMMGGIPYSSRIRISIHSIEQSGGWYRLFM